jgi:coproporphyrinogen III oxidase-like Fe-S oxidoreductase
MVELGVYVHWPYCARICPYCDFNVVRDRGKTDEQAGLADAIVADLIAQRALTGRAGCCRSSSAAARPR